MRSDGGSPRRIASRNANRQGEIAWCAHGDGVLEEEPRLDWNGWVTAEARRRPRAGWEGNRRSHGDEFIRCVEDRLTGGLHDSGSRTSGSNRLLASRT